MFIVAFDDTQFALVSNLRRSSRSSTILSAFDRGLQLPAKVIDTAIFKVSNFVHNAIHLGKDAVFDLEFDVKIDPVVDDAIDFAIDREFELMTDRAEVGGGVIFCVIFALRMLKVINACANEPHRTSTELIVLLPETPSTVNIKCKYWLQRFLT